MNIQNGYQRKLFYQKWLFRHLFSCSKVNLLHRHTQSALPSQALTVPYPHLFQASIYHLYKTVLNSKPVDIWPSSNAQSFLSLFRVPHTLIWKLMLCFLFKLVQKLKCVHPETCHDISWRGVHQEDQNKTEAVNPPGECRFCFLLFRPRPHMQLQKKFWLELSC